MKKHEIIGSLFSKKTLEELEQGDFFVLVGEQEKKIYLFTGIAKGRDYLCFNLDSGEKHTIVGYKQIYKVLGKVEFDLGV